MIFRSATSGWPGNAFRSSFTAAVPWLSARGVPISSQSAPAATATAAIARASSMVFRSSDTCTRPLVRFFLLRVLISGLTGLHPRWLAGHVHCGRSAEPPAARVAQEVDGLPQFVHAVHAVFDADPAVVTGLGEDTEDLVVVVEPAPDHAVQQVRGVADGAVRLPERVQGGTGREVAVRRLHGDDAADHALKEPGGVLARDDRIGRIELHAEAGALLDRVEEGKE